MELSAWMHLLGSFFPRDSSGAWVYADLGGFLFSWVPEFTRCLSPLARTQLEGSPSQQRSLGNIGELYAQEGKKMTFMNKLHSPSNGLVGTICPIVSIRRSYGVQ